MLMKSHLWTRSARVREIPFSNVNIPIEYDIFNFLVKSSFSIITLNTIIETIKVILLYIFLI